MRFHSNTQSIRAGEVSLLSIVETLAACTLAIGLGMGYASWTHVLVGAGVAPFLLLRTDDSCAFGVQRFARVLKKGETIGGPASFWGFLLCLIWPIVVLSASIPLALLFRIWATIRSVAMHPSEAVGAIPGNWWRIVMATDSTTSPEWLPLPLEIERYPDLGLGMKVTAFRVYNVIPTLRDLRSARTLRDCIGFAFLLAVSLGLLVVAFAYRLSIKSTAFVWLPVLWAIKPARHGEPAVPYLRLFLRSDFVRVVIAFSAIELVLFAAKYALFVAGHRFATNPEVCTSLAGARLGPLIAAIYRPGEIPLWQIGASVNALLAIAAWLIARGYLRRLEEGLPVKEAQIDATLGRLLRFRRLLTSYAIVCNVWAIGVVAKDLPRPPIGSRVFPWL